MGPGTAPGAPPAEIGMIDIVWLTTVWGVFSPPFWAVYAKLPFWDGSSVIQMIQ